MNTGYDIYEKLSKDERLNIENRRFMSLQEEFKIMDEVMNKHGITPSDIKSVDCMRLADIALKNCNKESN